MNEPEKYFTKDVLEKIDEQQKTIPLLRIRDMFMYKETTILVV